MSRQKGEAVARKKHSEQPNNIPHGGLWELGITELEGHNIEAAGREKVNKMLAEGWVLLHVYTLKYHEDNVWRERPMAILGKPKG